MTHITQRGDKVRKAAMEFVECPSIMRYMALKRTMDVLMQAEAHLTCTDGTCTVVSPYTETPKVRS